ncbi:MAG: TRAM domain-containing protein [Acidobacteria bacterium]|nr:TRAM domain-containing protein [Acidobacteriota bacterium]NIT09997.1 TRAM domain-containing protein [Acidobacteriota bacterium]
MLSRLQSSAYLDVTLDTTDVPGGSVDHKLLQLAADQNMRVLTTDYNLDKVAEIQGVPVLNLNELAQSLKPQVIPGESINVEVQKRGESANQGVGYLPDGTMVVIEEAARHIGEEIAVVVTNSLQTSAGRMIFGKVGEGGGRSAAAARPERSTASGSTARN